MFQVHPYASSLLLFVDALFRTRCTNIPLFVYPFARHLGFVHFLDIVAPAVVDIFTHALV